MTPENIARREKFKSAFASKYSEINKNKTPENIELQPDIEYSKNTALDRRAKFRAAFSNGIEPEFTEENKQIDKSNSFSWPRFIGENLSQGVFGLGDLAQFLVHIAPGNAPLKKLQETMHKNYGSPKPQEESIVPFSEISNKFLKEKGVNLQSMGTGSTPAQRLVGSAARAIPSAAIGGPVGLARNALVAGVMGATSQGLQEVGVPEGAADLATLGGAVFGPSLISKTKSLFNPSVSKLSSAERKVADMAKSDMSENEIKNAISSIEDYPVNSITGYDPLTAEVAQSPTLAQYHRVRQPIPESRISQRSGEEGDKIMSALEKRQIGALQGHELQRELQSELEERILKRTKGTKEGYDKIEKLKERVNPIHTKKHLKENSNARGTVESDLEKIKKSIQTKDFGAMSREEQKASILKYKKQLKDVPEYLKGTNHYKELKKALEPDNLHPTVSELDSTLKYLGDLRQKRLKSGEKQAALKIRQAMNALEKDTESFPIVKQTRSKYRELSKPVNEIERNKKISSIINSRSNDVMKYVFDNQSHANISDLKKIFGEKPEIWQGLQAAGFKKFKNSITNAGSNGQGKVISPYKVEEYLSKHEKALSELYSEDQIGIIKEISNITKGQNFSKTAGMASGSPTQANTRVEENIRKKLGLKDNNSSLANDIKGEFLNKIPVLGKLKKYLSKHKEEKLMKVLDKVLLDKDFALKLLKSSPEIKNQIQFNKFMNESLRKGAALNFYSKKEYEEKSKKDRGY